MQVSPVHLSACLIVKNESKQLARCLNSIVSVVDEIVVVDTGSTDNTLEIASKFTHKIYHFDWCDDFSKARNESLKHAAGEWILIIDADEHLSQNSQANLKGFLSQQDSSKPQVFNFLVTAPGQQNMFTRALFPRLHGFQFKGRVHESLRYHGAIPLQFHCSNLVYHHAPTTLKERQAKAKRYIPLMRAELQDEQSPQERFTLLFHLGKAWQLTQEYEKAIKTFTQAHQIFPQTDISSLDLMYLNLLHPLIHLNFKKDPLKALMYIEEALSLQPELTEAYALKALCYFYLEKHQESLLLWEDLLTERLGALSTRWQITAQITQGRCHLALNQVSQAIKFFEPLSLSHRNPELQAHLFRAYLMGNQRDKAKALYPKFSIQESSKALLKAPFWRSFETEVLNLE